MCVVAYLLPTYIYSLSLTFTVLLEKKHTAQNKIKYYYGMAFWTISRVKQHFFFLLHYYFEFMNNKFGNFKVCRNIEGFIS